MSPDNSFNASGIRLIGIQLLECCSWIFPAALIRALGACAIVNSLTTIHRLVNDTSARLLTERLIWANMMFDLGGL